MNGDAREERPNWASVEALRDDLLARSRNSRGGDAIRHVVEACETLKKGGNSITIAAVGKFCVTNWGGPRGSSISNNRELANLVHMAAAVQEAAGRTPAKKGRGTWEEDLLGRIDDPHVRSQVQILLVDRRSLLRENNALKAGFKRVKALEVLTPEMATANIQTLEQLAELLRTRLHLDTNIDFTDEERTACREFLDPKRLKNEGWAIDEASGEIQSAVSKRPVAVRGLVSALRKVARLEPPRALEVSGSDRR